MSSIIFFVLSPGFVTGAVSPARRQYLLRDALTPQSREKFATPHAVVFSWVPLFVNSQRRRTHKRLPCAIVSNMCSRRLSERLYGAKHSASPSAKYLAGIPRCCGRLISDRRCAVGYPTANTLWPTVSQFCRFVGPCVYLCMSWLCSLLDFISRCYSLYPTVCLAQSPFLSLHLAVYPFLSPSPAEKHANHCVS